MGQKKTGNRGGTPSRLSLAIKKEPDKREKKHIFEKEQINRLKGPQQRSPDRGLHGKEKKQIGGERKSKKKVKLWGGSWPLTEGVQTKVNFKTEEMGKKNRGVFSIHRESPEVCKARKTGIRDGKRERGKQRQG